MSLTASEERVLTRIEEALLSRDPCLKSLFAIFTRLTWQEAMPSIEQLRRRRWQPPAGAVILLAVALIVGVIVIRLARFDQRGRPGSAVRQHRGPLSAGAPSASNGLSPAFDLRRLNSPPRARSAQAATDGDGGDHQARRSNDVRMTIIRNSGPGCQP